MKAKANKDIMVLINRQSLSKEEEREYILALQKVINNLQK